MDTNEITLTDRIRDLLEQDEIGELRRLLVDSHPADIADAVDVLEDDQRLRIFSLLDDQTAAEVLDETEAEATSSLLKDLDSERAADILDEMPTDDAVEILEDLPKEQADELIGLMEVDEAAEVKESLAYPENSAGRLMTEEFVAVTVDMTAADVLGMLRAVAPRAETAYYLYVTDPGDTLVGVLSLRDLVVADPRAKVGDVMSTKVVSVGVDTDQEEVARVVSKYDFLAVPVIDEAEKLVGIVTVDDVIDVIEEEASEDIYLLSGTTEDPEAVHAPANMTVRRLPWLLVTIIGELMVAQVIRGFEEQLLSVIFALVLFIPVVMATGGNVGTQSLAMTVRSLALGELVGKSIYRLIGREVLVGVMLGMACGFFTGGLAALWLGDFGLGLVIFISMTVTLMFSAVMGSLIPIGFKALGKDPALASGPFITTLNDITSVTIYFLLAMQLLPRL